MLLKSSDELRQMSDEEFWRYFKMPMKSRRFPKNKREFGRLMHDPNLSEEEKQQLLEDVQVNGGYECLQE